MRSPVRFRRRCLQVAVASSRRSRIRPSRRASGHDVLRPAATNGGSIIFRRRRRRRRRWLGFARQRRPRVSAWAISSSLGAEHLVGEATWLGWMQLLPRKPRRRASCGLGAIAVGVPDVGERAVVGKYTGLAGGHAQREHRLREAPPARAERCPVARTGRRGRAAARQRADGPRQRAGGAAQRARRLDVQQQADLRSAARQPFFLLGAPRSRAAAATTSSAVSAFGRLTSARPGCTTASISAAKCGEPIALTRTISVLLAGPRRLRLQQCSQRLRGPRPCGLRPRSPRGRRTGRRLAGQGLGEELGPRARDEEFASHGRILMGVSLGS